MNWYQLALRWADKCVSCGETDQNKITFSQCFTCRSKKNEKRKKEEEAKKNKG